MGTSSSQICLGLQRSTLGRMSPNPVLRMRQLTPLGVILVHTVHKAHGSYCERATGRAPKHEFIIAQKGRTL